MKQQGKVRVWIKERGFGFIAVEYSVRDVFFHARSWASNGRPQPGQDVEFELIDGLEGKPKQAVNVTAIETPVVVGSGRTV